MVRVHLRVLLLDIMENKKYFEAILIEGTSQLISYLNEANLSKDDIVNIFKEGPNYTIILYK